MQPRSGFDIRCLAGTFAAFARADRGVIAVMLAIMLAAILGVMALAVDLGRAWNLQTELQNAADAAALAGATQLDNKPGAIFRARLAAETSGNALSENRQRFATDNADDWNVVITAPDVRFLQSLNPRIYIDETDVDADQQAEFIEVTIAPRRVDFMFAAVVGAVTSASPSGMAVAGLGQAVCLVPPIMICNPNEPDPNTTDPNASFKVEDYIGAGILLKAAGNGTAWKPGNFGLLSLSNNSLSTNDIRDAMGRYPPLELCFGESVGTKPGQSTAVRQGLNMRFDMYSGVAGGLETEAAYRPSRNPVKGMIKGSQCMWGGQGWKHPENRYVGHLNPNSSLAFNGDPLDGTLADAVGFPRDKCAYPAPDGPDNCDALTSGARFGDGDWDIATYMWINHGKELDPFTVSTLDTTTLGLHQYLDFNGDGRVTRHDVYMWELSNEMPGWPLSPNTDEESSYDSMQCATEGMPEETDPDRRELVIAVLNCNYHDIKGSTPDVPVLMWVKLFMTEPMGTYESNNDLYAEFVGPADMDVVGRYVVQLYE